jgi:glycogen debranching enzyme
MLSRTILVLFLAALPALAQPFGPVPSLPFDTTNPVIRANAEPQKPFTVAGERGVVVGQQDGTFEAWVLPIKLLSHFTIEAQMRDYPVPIDVNQHAAAIEVRPDRTILTYSHPGFTLRQIMFSPAGKAGAGPIVLFQFDCLRPTDFTFRFTPELRWMWPERNEGVPGVEWVPQPLHANTGLYILHADYPDLAAAITIPGAEPGILTPYQERPQVHAAELKLHIDPARDNGRLFPLLMAVGTNIGTASSSALIASLEQLNASIPAAYQAQADRYKQLLAGSVSIETPDKSLNEAFQWAVISIEQLKTNVFQPDTTTTNTPEEAALVAGYLVSADSARPGYGWFFGRDALYTLYAVNGYGDFELTRAELEFLIHRQREDGKIMHEYSQTAASIDWRAFPYMYAAADSTPLFLMAMADYARHSGDTAFLATHRDAIEKAWAFETNPAEDTDHDGIYDNSQGTGWVESWPGGMPHQEIYLALLDQQASSAYAYIEEQLHDSAKAVSARTRASAIAKTINTEYYDLQKGCYSFATDPPGIPTPGSLPGEHNPIDRTITVYPALAWWDPAEGKSILDHSDRCLEQFVSSSLNTDWGLRDVANTEKIYDGMSYHQGSVWPLFTGWAALAEYRGNQPLAGYQILKENANLTWAQDLGSVTELLSGDFFVPFGRSTSHQLWSSAMVITPTLRGLFGISVDATTKTVIVNPHLPSDWPRAEIKNLRVGDQNIDLEFVREEGVISIRTALQTAQSGIRLASDEQGAKVTSKDRNEITIPSAPLEGYTIPLELPQPGARTAEFRVVNESHSDHKLTLTLEGPPDSDGDMGFNQWTRQAVNVKVTVDPAPTSAALSKDSFKLRSSGDDYVRTPGMASAVMHIHFPPGLGWQTITVTLSW